jgi:hypothetical protein
MLNLAYLFDDANQALTRHSDHLKIAPLPAAVYMMQVDVINHYHNALDHYLTLTLNEPYLQKSSLGPPYRKWAFFTNKDFEMLSFAIHNLLRYTSRLWHETEHVALQETRRFSEMKGKSNTYTKPLCDIKYQHKSIGIVIDEDNHLSITALRVSPPLGHIVTRGKSGGPSEYLLVTRDAAGQEHERAIEEVEYMRRRPQLRPERLDIGDRSTLAALRDRGKKEISELVSKNELFGNACNEFYRSVNPAAPFKNLNQEYWT